MSESTMLIASIVIAVFGIIRIQRGDVVIGTVLLLVALLVGTGGASIVSR